MKDQQGTILSVNRAGTKGTKKHPVGAGRFVEEQGMELDAHAGPGERQVSLLAKESIDKMRAKGLEVDFGAFAENLTTEGIDLAAFPLGTRLRIGGEVRLEITRIGKECHARCQIYHTVEDCVMPREGVFARVLAGGVVSAGDRIDTED